MTPNKKRLATMICIVSGSMVCSHAAVASGYLPTPEQRETLQSYKACLAVLSAAATEYRAQAKPKTFNQDGGFQEVYLEDRSGGVKVIGRKRARYEARIWYHYGFLRDNGTQYEITHSWNGGGYECRGKMLITNLANGYTLSTFQAVPSKVP